MATEAQLAAIKKAQDRKNQIDEWQQKAEKYDKIVEAFHDEGFSYNRRQQRLVALRNNWAEFFEVMKQTCGLNENDSSLL